MQKKLFRQKSLDRISSPESLNEYLHVTNVSIWVVLIAVILMLGGLFVWSGIASVESFAYGVAQVEDNVLKMHFDNEQVAQSVEEGMIITVGNEKASVISVGTDENGQIIAAATVQMPDGIYDAKVNYKSTRMIELLFN